MPVLRKVNFHLEAHHRPHFDIVAVKVLLGDAIADHDDLVAILEEKVRCRSSCTERQHAHRRAARSAEIDRFLIPILRKRFILVRKPEEGVRWDRLSADLPCHRPTRRRSHQTPVPPDSGPTESNSLSGLGYRSVEVIPTIWSQRRA